MKEIAVGRRWKPAARGGRKAVSCSTNTNAREMLFLSPPRTTRLHLCVYFRFTAHRRVREGDVSGGSVLVAVAGVRLQRPHHVANGRGGGAAPAAAQGGRGAFALAAAKMMWTASALLGSGDGGRGGRGEDDGAPPCGWWPRRKETTMTLLPWATMIR
uniref:DUF834 domain-containing protein n=1 Tax=Oryza rufipogon TaxID=4529 RepID=A0A0E0PHM3_ORYRU